MNNLSPLNSATETNIRKVKSGGPRSGNGPSLSKHNGRTHSGRFTELDPEKLRGGYYTSPHLANWLAKWVIRRRTDTVLEPSCGDGVFLDAAAARLARLGAGGPTIADKLTGVEIIPAEAEKAQHLRWIGTPALCIDFPKDDLRNRALPELR